MKRGFLGEINRLDASPSPAILSYDEPASVYDDDHIPTHEEFISWIKETLAGKMAIELDSSKNNFTHDHYWRVRYYLNSPGEEFHYGSLGECLAILERENIFSREVMSKTSVPDDDTFLKVLDKAHIDYRKNIVLNCYENGEFKTDNWDVCLADI